jgi:hypothetical protein
LLPIEEVGMTVAVGGDLGRLDDRVVEVPEESLTDLHAELRQVDVVVVAGAVVDLGPHRRIGLVGGAQPDAVDPGQLTVELGGGGGPGEDVDGEVAALLVGRLDPPGQRRGEFLGVSGPRETAEADLGAVMDESGGVVGAHHLLTQRLVGNPI